MTLVVGRVTDGHVYMFGDTALMRHHSANANPILQGCLKLYLVSDTIALAFAGNQPDFEDICAQLLMARDANQVVQIGLAKQSEGGDFELMVAEIGYPSLRIVKDAQLTEVVAGFIGDPIAFNAYQTAFHAREQEDQNCDANRMKMQILLLPEPLLDELYSRMFNSIRDVITDPAIHTVGGIVVPLCSHNGRFSYMYYADITSDQLRLDDFGPEPKAIEFGTDVGGGYAFEFEDDTPRGGDGRNIAVYFVQGGFGAVFQDFGTGIRVPQLVRGENPALWTLNTEKLLGNGFLSGYLTADHCGIAGEELLHRQQWADADFVYSLRTDLATFDGRADVLERFIVGRATAMFMSGKQAAAINELQNFVANHRSTTVAQKQLVELLKAIDR